MIGVDPASAVIDFSTLQSLESSPSVDQRGLRRTITMFREGTVATMELEGGETEILPEITVHATEYTVADAGPTSMPGPLPRSSGYTYALEYTVEEAEAAGAVSISFEPPVVSYVDNFTNFPVGVEVPAGSWDERRGVWNPSSNGLIVEILDIDADGNALLDVDGDGEVEDDAMLQALGISDGETKELAGHHKVGARLWRIEIPHFSAWDYNWGVKPPESAESPPDVCPEENQPIEEACIESGSVIECENQVLGEVVSLAGTSLTLNYRSSRAKDGPGYRLAVPVTGSDPLPEEIQGARVWADVAGKRLEATYSAVEMTPNLFHEFTWDGKDVYGNPVQGHEAINACVSWLYPVQYTTSFSPSTSKFGYDGDGAVIGTIFIAGVQSMSMTRCYGRIPVGTGGANDAISTPRKLLIGGLNAFAVSDALGGWTLSNHHTYSPHAGMLYRGNGDSRDVGAGIPMIETFAGTEAGNGPWDGDERLSVQLGTVESLAVSKNGDVYVGYEGRIISVVADDDMVITVAGGGISGYAGDGGQATDAQISTPLAMDVGPDGSLYFIDRDNLRIRKISAEGVIGTVVGDGTYQTDIDALPEALSGVELTADMVSLGGLNGNYDLAVGPEGSIYYLTAIAGHGYIRRVLPDGRVRHFAGYPSAGLWVQDPEGFVAPGWDFATPAFRLSAPGQTAYGLDVDGEGRVFAGTTSSLVQFDGTAHSLSSATDISAGAVALAITPEGGVVWSDTGDRAIYTIENNERRRLAGAGDDEISSNIPAYNAKFLYAPKTLSFGPDGSLYVGYKNLVRRIYVDGPGRVISGQTISVPSRDGAEVYVFDSKGRHLATRDRLTDLELWSFDYDSDGRLLSTTDHYGRDTVIERDAAGKATAIVGPTGITTQLAIADNELRAITDPNAKSYLFKYDEGGRLTSMIDRRGEPHIFTYDTEQRLVKDQDPTGGSKSLMRSKLEDGFLVEVSTDLGVSQYHSVERPAGDVELRRTHISSSGQTETETYPDGSRVSTYPDGTVMKSQLSPDPDFGMAAAYTSRTDITLPKSQQTISRHFRYEHQGEEWIAETSWYEDFSVATESRYNIATREYTLTTAEGRVFSAVLEADGQPSSISPPAVESTVVIHDADGKLVEIRQGAGTELRRRIWGYDNNDFVDVITSYLGLAEYTRSFQRDFLGQVSTSTLPDLTIIGTQWDPEGLALELQPAGRPPHVFEYNASGDLATYIPPPANDQDPPGSAAVRFKRDQDHRLISVSRANGDVISITYQPGTNLVDVIEANQGMEMVPSYDSFGRATAVSGPYGVNLNFIYDGSVLTETIWEGSTQGAVSHGLDAHGRVANNAINGSMVVDFEYDNDGLLLVAGQATLTRDFASGRIANVTIGGVSQAHAYDAFGDVSVVASKFGQADVYSYELQHNQFGRITSDVQTVGGVGVVWEYHYNARGWLVAVDKNGMPHEQYEYDENGNRSSIVRVGVASVATHDDQDRLISEGETFFISDSDGNVVQKTRNGEVWVYDHDPFGDLRQVIIPNGDVISYEYDAAGRRVARYVNGIFERGWLWDGQWRPVAEVDETGVVQARYVYGSRTHVPDYVEVGGTTYQLLVDERGSVRRVIEVDSGVVVHDVEYGPWGEIESEQGAAVQSFGYAGGLRDADTGLILFGERSYDPESGRWMARDPSLFGGGQANLFAYAGNDPINFIDITGMAPGQLYPTRAAAVVDAVADLRNSIVAPGAAITEANPESGTEIYEVELPLCGFGMCFPARLYSYYAPERPLFAPPDNWTPMQGSCPQGARPVMELHTHPNGMLGTGRGDMAAARADNIALVVVTKHNLWYFPAGDFETEVEIRQLNGLDQNTMSFLGPL